MRPRLTFSLMLAVAVTVSLASAGVDDAQQRDTARAGRPAPAQPAFRSQSWVTPNRDLILEIPELAVDSIGLRVANVSAHVALDANAMNLVQITAGVDVGIKEVQLGIVRRSASPVPAGSGTDARAVRAAATTINRGVRTHRRAVRLMHPRRSSAARTPSVRTRPIEE